MTSSPAADLPPLPCDDDNRPLQLAWEFVEHTGMSVFLTGKAGTGKTTFLKQLRQHSTKSMIVVAPTGVAAINAGGVTIHSFFQLPPSPFIPGSHFKEKYSFAKEKLRIIRALDLLVIDEISMVRADLLDAIDHTLRRYRRSSDPFGGVQLLMIGDLQQLAPVMTPADQQLLAAYYPTPYFFSSKGLQAITYATIELEKVYRQQDPAFIALLNGVRSNSLSAAELRLLNSRLRPSFIPDPSEGYIRLTALNSQADSYNRRQMAQLPAAEAEYKAEVKGQFPESSYPTSERLVLKKGAQVMFLKNDTSPEKRFYNGKIGIVTRTGTRSVTVRCPGEPEEIIVEPMTWENTRYSVNETTNTIEPEVQGSFSQIPLRPAWAVTIHKSQGLTFDKVIIDASASFAPGQVYVALSRCRTLQGIVLASPVAGHHIISDSAVEQYLADSEASTRREARRLGKVKEEYFRHLMMELFSFREILQLQQSLAAQLLRSFRHSYANETTRQQAITPELESRVGAIADKWLPIIAATPYATLASADFLSRTGNSAAYFSRQLRDIFADTLTPLEKLKSDNKQASQRLRETATELHQLLHATTALLDAIARDGFSIENYLTHKQIARLDATRPAALKRVASGGRFKEKSLSPKAEPKLSAGDQTRRLYAQGLDIDEIARQRAVKPATVIAHLMRDIYDGRATADEIFPPTLINALTSAIERLGAEQATLRDAQALLPDTFHPLLVDRLFYHLRARLRKPASESDDNQ